MPDIVCWVILFLKCIFIVRIFIFVGHDFIQFVIAVFVIVVGFVGVVALRKFILNDCVFFYRCAGCISLFFFSRISNAKTYLF